MDMTNLHFHGLNVSPDAPQDDVLTMLARPGQVLHYSVRIPRDHPPGLFWYHTHPHGESHRQVLDGMSGAIVIEGMERYVPEVGRLRERVIVVRSRSIEHDPNASALVRDVEVPAQGCAGGAESVEEIFTVNGVLRPRIEIAPKERQFWRIVNASADRYLDLLLDGQTFEIVALDGMPLAYRDPKHPTRVTDHLLVAPAGRLEAIVTGPPPGEHKSLRTLCSAHPRPHPTLPSPRRQTQVRLFQATMSRSQTPLERRSGQVTPRHNSLSVPGPILFRSVITVGSTLATGATAQLPDHTWSR